MKGDNQKRATSAAVAAGVLVVGVLVEGCAAPGAVGRSDVQRSISVAYGTIQAVEPVDIKSNAGAGAVVGGLAGLLLTSTRSRQSQIAGTLAGATLGGLGTRAAEGANKGNAFTVGRNDGTVVKVITEQQDVRVGDCVAVESGTNTNLRRVSHAMCEPSGTPMDARLLREDREEAEECEQAKQELLAAQNGADVDTLIRKVRVLCEH